MMSCCGTAFVRFLCPCFLGGFLCFLLLELIEYAVCLISILALLEEADERDVAVWQHFVHFCIPLLVLPWHQEEICLIFSILVDNSIVKQRSPFQGSP